jgi:hypothetical protein
LLVGKRALSHAHSDERPIDRSQYTAMDKSKCISIFLLINF